jgi:desulfoferrodoxin-like iron-binding protein
MANVTDEGQVYKCEICGNVVVVKTAGGGELVCHGEPMKLIGEKGYRINPQTGVYTPL